MNSMDSYEGTWGTDEPGQPLLLLVADGTVTGTDGCNRLMGKWTLDEDVIHFQQMVSTMMFCEGIDTWLNGAASAKLQGDSLQVFDRGGVGIGTLHRQA